MLLNSVFPKLSYLIFLHYFKVQNEIDTAKSKNGFHFHVLPDLLAGSLDVIIIIPKLQMFCCGFCNAVIKYLTRKVHIKVAYPSLGGKCQTL